MAEVKVYEDAIDKGLEGIVACTTKISSIQGNTLTYRGYTIEDLAANSTFEEVVFLLWNDRLPNKSELETLKKDLNTNMKLSGETVSLMKSLPAKKAIPMDFLRTVVSSLSMTDPDVADNSEAANMRKALRLTGQICSIVAGFDRIRNGQSVMEPKPGQGLAWNFVYMLTGKEPDAELAKNFDTCLVLHADHEINCSAFSARVTTSSLSDIHSAVTSAIGTLKGPLHGGANEQVLRMLQKIGNLDACEEFITQALADKAKVMGIGHRVYKDGDPRAKILRKMSDQLTAKIGKHVLYEMSSKIDDIMQEKKGLMPNVDFYSATVYHSMGFPTDIFTPIFAVSRIAGWCAHIMEQYPNNRIYRPRGKYAGKTGQKFVPLASR